MADHRELARDIDLFHFEQHSPGMVFWHPQGLRLFCGIEEFMRQVYQARGFEEVRSPLFLVKQLPGRKQFSLGSANWEWGSNFTTAIAQSARKFVNFLNEKFH